MSKFTKIKLCGMTRAVDVGIACELGVDAVGFIFYPKSKRFVDIKSAKVISQQMPSSIAKYAVVVNPCKQWVEILIKDFKPTVIQFHGDESPEFCQQFDYPYIKAVSAKSAQSIIEASQRYHSAQAILLDTPAGSDYGGSGQTFDWQILPQPMDKPFILAGGLTVDNVLDAIKLAKPVMVDCCSGVELEPGIKSEVLMRQFVHQVRGE